MQAGIIIQARCSSKRLKNKILMELPAGSGISLLGRVIMRAKKACPLVVVATSTMKDDDKTEKEALKYGAFVYRGDLDDVLIRYINAAKEYNIDIIVRITADCPCIDPEIIKKLINDIIETNSDYASNIEPRSFPHGLDTEVVTLKALEQTDIEEKDINVREHVTWYIRQHHHFSKVNIINDLGVDYSNIRITIDTIEDYAVLNIIFMMLQDNFNYKDIIKMYEQYPWISTLNNNIYQKYVFKSKQEEITEAIKLLKLNNMDYASKELEKLK